jgi:allantoinase
MTSVRSNNVMFRDGIRPATLRLEDGLIVGVSQAMADHDFGDLVILPGLVDSHVHINEPGRADWEGFTTATRAAAAGGATTLVDMPLNSIPPTVSVEALEVKLAAAEGKLSTDVAFWGGIVPGSEPNIEDLVAAGVCGFKSFLVDSGVPEFAPMSPMDLEPVIPRLGELGVPLLLHAEAEHLLRPMVGDAREYLEYLRSRPAESETEAVRTAAGLAAGKARVHILHVSSGDAAAAISAGPANLTGETCPHYLTFAAEEIGSGATAFKCAPPIRESEERERLWEALVTGSISMIVSDHSPAPADIKELESGDFGRAWGGVGSLQLRLPVVWTGASARGVTLDRLGDWLSYEPARLAGLGTKGIIEAGMDADLVIFDPDGRSLVKGENLEHRHAITPYDGMVLRGTVVSTVLGGQTVYQGGQIQLGLGRTLKRND